VVAYLAQVADEELQPDAWLAVVQQDTRLRDRELDGC
jgi:hypothetical protein